VSVALKISMVMLGVLKTGRSTLGLPAEEEQALEEVEETQVVIAACSRMCHIVHQGLKKVLHVHGHVLDDPAHAIQNSCQAHPRAACW